MITIVGKAVSRGAAFGKIRFLGKQENSGQAVSVGTDDPCAEWDRFSAAGKAAVLQLKKLEEQAAASTGKSAAEMFQVQQALVCDPYFCSQVKDNIFGHGMAAANAVTAAAEAFGQLLAQTGDDRFSSRREDLSDAAKRICGILGGNAEDSDVPEETDACIICADDLSPAQTALLDKKKTLAFVTRKGSAYSHTAILARSMEIPAIVGTGGSLLEKYDGCFAAVDAFDGRLIISPDGISIGVINEKLREHLERKQLERALIGKENITADGRRIEILANAACAEDVELAVRNDAGGIGLFRSEFLFMERDSLPGEEEQFCIYKEAAQRLCGKPLVIRAADLGADKVCGLLGGEQEENPALGKRGIRLLLERTDIFAVQLRAVLRASAYGNVSVMFPMITSLWELKRAKSLLFQLKEELAAQRVPFDKNIPVGIMIETPAAAITSDILARQADFFSIGTNDLTQYVLAADRSNHRLDRYDSGRHKAVMRLIGFTAENAKKSGIPCCICGELAADGEVTAELIRMGAGRLSVPPADVLTIRKAVREANITERYDYKNENKTYRFRS